MHNSSKHWSPGLFDDQRVRAALGEKLRYSQTQEGSNEI